MISAQLVLTKSQAATSESRTLWVESLSNISEYWRIRCEADTAQLKHVRKLNLARFGPDESVEARIGQFAAKWELVGAAVEPQLHHFCRLTSCRPISVSFHSLFRSIRITCGLS